jgi:hypothetical protein
VPGVLGVLAADIIAPLTSMYIDAICCSSCCCCLLALSCSSTTGDRRRQLVLSVCDVRGLTGALPSASMRTLRMRPLAASAGVRRGLRGESAATSSGRRARLSRLVRSNGSSLGLAGTLVVAPASGLVRIGLPAVPPNSADIDALECNTGHPPPVPGLTTRVGGQLDALLPPGVGLPATSRSAFCSRATALLLLARRIGLAETIWLRSHE